MCNIYTVVEHLKNVEQILVSILQNTNADNVLVRFCEDIEEMVEQHILYRDLDNFLAYFSFLLSSTHIPKSLQFGPVLVNAFIERTYAEYDDDTQKDRAQKLYDYLKHRLPDKSEMKSKEIQRLESELRKAEQPTFENIKRRVSIGLILKWLQGPLEDRLSNTLRDFITFIATVYGQYRSGRIFVVDWQACSPTDKDRELLHSEYQLFECALMEALQQVRQAIEKGPKSEKYQDQFRIVLISLDNLVKLTKKGELESPEAFKDKIIVATALIYVQDEYVEKNAELQKLIQLFVSLYRQFRDKHYSAKKNKE